MSLVERKVIKVFIGQVVVTRSPHVLLSVLGSCVGLVMFDSQAALGGMAHVFLPSSQGKVRDDLPGKFADHAVDCLYEGMLEHGAQRQRLRAKLAGGAQMFPGLCAGSTDVGSAIVAVVRRRLTALDVPVLAAAVGGSAGRRVEFDTADWSYLVEDFAQRKEVL